MAGMIYTLYIFPMHLPFVRFGQNKKIFCVCGRRGDGGVGFGTTHSCLAKDNKLSQCR